VKVEPDISFGASFLARALPMRAFASTAMSFRVLAWASRMTGVTRPSSRATPKER